MKYRTLIIQFFFFLLFLSLLESGSFLFLTNTRQHKIYNVLKLNKRSIWRVKPNLDLDFFGGKTITDAKGFRVEEKVHAKQFECKKNIGIFGASPSFGWGVNYQETYTALLHQEFRDRGYCFKNFSQIGFSSTQGSILFKEVIKKHQLDFAVITYLVNDLDFVRFYHQSDLTDLEEIKLSKNRSKPSFFWPPSIVKLALYLKSFYVDPSEFSKNKVRRVSPDEVKQNHLSMISTAKNHDIEVLNVQLPIGSEFFLNSKKAIKLKKSQQFALQALTEAYNYRKMVKETWFNEGEDSIEVSSPKTYSELRAYFLAKQGDFIHFSKHGHVMIFKELTRYFTKKL